MAPDQFYASAELSKEALMKVLEVGPWPLSEADTTDAQWGETG
jgi:hypothetical protein